MASFDRELWLNEAGSLWARLINTQPSDFYRQVFHPAYVGDEELIWILLKRAGIATQSLRGDDWRIAQVSMSEYWLEAASLPDIAMYFSWLKEREKFHQGCVAEDFSRGRLLAAFRRLIEWGNDLPYDTASSPWYKQSE